MPVTVLVVSPCEEDLVFLGRVLGPPGWRVEQAGNCRQAFAVARRILPDLVISDPDLADGNWQDLWSRMAERAGAPKLVVTSAAADRQLWAAVINVGGFDLLLKPFDAHEVLWVAAAATSVRRAQIPAVRAARAA